MIVCLTSAFHHAYQCITSIKYHALPFLPWPAVDPHTPKNLEASLNLQASSLGGKTFLNPLSSCSTLAKTFSKNTSP